MSRLHVASTQKIDEELSEMILSDSYDGSTAIPIVVRTTVDLLPVVSLAIENLGGRVRGVVKLVGAVAAWVPLRAIGELADRNEVTRISISEQCVIA